MPHALFLSQRLSKGNNQTMTLSKTFPFCLQHLLIPQTFRPQHTDSHTHTHIERRGKYSAFTNIHSCPPANQSCESAIGNVATKANTWYAGICFVAYLHCSTVQSNCCLAGPAKSFLFSFSLLLLIIFSLPPSAVFRLLCSAYGFAALNCCIGKTLLEYCVELCQLQSDRWFNRNAKDGPAVADRRMRMESMQTGKKIPHL